jgi:hypothetical protein
MDDDKNKNKNLMSLGELTDTRQSNLNGTGSGTKLADNNNLNTSLEHQVGPNKLSNNAMKLKSLEDKMNGLEVCIAINSLGCY